MKLNDHHTALKILTILADGKFHSGETLAAQFRISRVAIHKQIAKLGLWGLTVFAVKGKGYALSHPLCLYKPHPDNVLLHIASISNRPINLIPIIDSTNEYLLQRIPDAIQGEVCVAEYQFAARGRRGRRYFAPFGTNLYFSFHWCFNASDQIQGLTLLVGLVVAELLTELGVEQIQLKWPNDIYLDNKKLGGILVESKIKQGKLHVIIGIGLNLYMREADAQIVTQDWISLHQKEYFLDKNDLVTALQRTLADELTRFEKTGFEPYVIRWQQYDLLKHEAVQITFEENQQQVIKKGIYAGIDHDGALLVDQAVYQWLNEPLDKKTAICRTTLHKTIPTTKKIDSMQAEFKQASNLQYDSNHEIPLTRYLVGDVSLRKDDS